MTTTVTTANTTYTTILVAQAYEVHPPQILLLMSLPCIITITLILKKAKA